MSQTTLASVSIDLLANNASFIAGLNKAEASLKNSIKSMGNSISSLGSAISQTLGPLGGSIGAELSGMFSGIGSAVSDLSSKFSAAKGFTGELAVGLGGLAAVGVAVTGALAGMALSGGALAESLSLTSQKTGISIRDLQTLQAAGSTVGVGLDDIVGAMRKFSEALTGSGKGGGELTAVLQRLGVTSHDSNTALLQIADAFSKMPDGPIKSAEAVELFGRSGLTLVPLLNKGRDGLKEFSDIVTEFGPVIDHDAVEATERWKTSTLKLSEAWDSFKVSLSGGVGILAGAVDHIAKATKGMGDFLHVMGQHPKDVLAGLVTGDIGIMMRNVTPTDLPQQADSTQTQKAIDAQDALLQKYKEKYEVLKAGGAAQYALEKQQLAITNAVDSKDFQTAARLQEQIPALQQAVTLEKQRLAAAKEMLDVLTRQTEGKIHVSNPARNFQPVAAPELQTTAQQFTDVSESLQKLTNVGGVTDAVLKMGADAVADFYEEWDRDNKNTIDVINERFTDQLNNFKGMLALSAISQLDFNEISKDLETQRVAEIQKIQVKQGTDFATNFANVFADIADQADKFSKSLAESLGGALSSVSEQMASLATTGRANFAQIGKSLEGNVVKSGSDALIGVATKHIASAFGVKFGKPDGTQNNPIYTRSADSVADGAKALGGKLNLGGSLSKLFSGKGILKSIGKLFGGSGDSGSGDSGSGSGGGGLLGILGSLFGGFKAGGGDVMPGRAYVVGEQRPELFVPRAAGRIIPNVNGMSSSNQRPVQVNAHFHGITDADTFRQSKSQILGHLANAVGRAVSRR